MLSVCLWISPSPINFWLPETIFMKLGTWTYLISVLYKSLPSVSVSVCVSLLSLIGKGSSNSIPLFVARQRLGKHVPTATNIRNNRRTVGCVCLWACLCIPLLLPGNNSVKTFPRQRRILEGVVFYAVLVVSKESRCSVLPRTFCLLCKEITPIMP
jgi:hypothetical protein